MKALMTTALLGSFLVPQAAAEISVRNDAGEIITVPSAIASHDIDDDSKLIALRAANLEEWKTDAGYGLIEAVIPDSQNDWSRVADVSASNLLNAADAPRSPAVEECPSANSAVVFIESSVGDILLIDTVTTSAK
jgi:hypothetical protein